MLSVLDVLSQLIVKTQFNLNIINSVLQVMNLGHRKLSTCQAKIIKTCKRNSKLCILPEDSALITTMLPTFMIDHERQENMAQYLMLSNLVLDDR